MVFPFHWCVCRNHNTIPSLYSWRGSLFQQLSPAVNWDSQSTRSGTNVGRLVLHKAGVNFGETTIYLYDTAARSIQLINYHHGECDVEHKLTNIKREVRLSQQFTGWELQTGHVLRPSPLRWSWLLSNCNPICKVSPFSHLCRYLIHIFFIRHCHEGFTLFNRVKWIFRLRFELLPRGILFCFSIWIPVLKNCSVICLANHFEFFIFECYVTCK